MRLVSRRRREDRTLFRRAALGLALVVPVWTVVFRGEKRTFWTRMTVGAGSLGVYALASRADLRKQWPRPRDVAPGVVSAAGLYVLFQAGDRLARAVLSSGEEDIADVYELRSAAPRPLIALALATDIGPSEELFWRGLIQEAFMRRFGRIRGSVMAAAAYGLVHVVTGNPTLTAAAGVAGAYWGAEYALSPRLGPLLVSHVVWDIWIFLVAPTPTARSDQNPAGG